MFKFTKKNEMLDCTVISERETDMEHMFLIEELTRVLNTQYADERCKMVNMLTYDWDSSTLTSKMAIDIKVDRTTWEKVKKIAKVSGTSEVVA